MENMENGSFLEGNGIIILILFLLMFGWGGNGFGMGNAATQGALTRAEMNDGFNMAELQRNQADLKESLCGTNQQILQNRYDNALQACDLKTAIHAEGEATRAMIQQQTIDDLKSQLNTATAAIANATQTQNLANMLGRFYMNPPVNPYYAYGTGCGCNA